MKKDKGRARTGNLSRRWKGKRYDIHEKDALGKGTIYLRYMRDGIMVEKNLKTPDIDEAEKQRDLELLRSDLESEEDVLIRTKVRLEQVQQKLHEEKEKETPPLKLDGVWAIYLKSQNRPRSGKRTLDGYAAHYKKFQEWLSEKYPNIVYMRDVGIEEAEAYADHLTTLNLSPSTYNQKLNALSLIWRVLVEKASLKGNPFEWDKKALIGIQRRSIKAEEDQRKKRPLTVEEIDKVLTKAKGDFRTLIIILVCTGQRLVDGVKLEWKSIDFKKRLITLTPQKTGKRTGKIVQIPLFPQLDEELAGRKKSGRYVLPKLVKQYDADDSSVSKDLKEIFKAAKIETKKDTDLETGRAITDVGAHSLRHTFVTIARAAGIPDPMIFKITGHSSQEMMEHYTQFSEEMVASLAGQLLGGGKQKALPFSEMAKEPLPAWTAQSVKELIGLTNKISGKTNEKVKAEIHKVLKSILKQGKR